MPYQQDCSVLFLRALNEKAYELILEAPEIVAAAQPGQFVHVSCGEGRLLRRPISICEASGVQLRLVFEVRGEGTEWLSRRTKGERVSVLGPLGHGFDVDGKRVLFIGGGIGVPPLLWAAQRAAEIRGTGCERGGDPLPGVHGRAHGLRCGRMSGVRCETAGCPWGNLYGPCLQKRAGLFC